MAEADAAAFDPYKVLGIRRNATDIVQRVRLTGVSAWAGATSTGGF